MPVSVALWQVGDDEEEVRLAQAQVLMDCTADLLSQKGLDGTRAWCEGGIKLRCRSSGHSSSWVVLGQLPEDAGEGTAAAASPNNGCHVTTDDYRAVQVAAAIHPVHEGTHYSTDPVVG